MSHPNPSHDRSNQYPSDGYRPKGNLERPIKKMLDITPSKGVKSKALANKVSKVTRDNIQKDKGYSPISRKPMKESEMSPTRQYHREQVRKAQSAKSKALQGKSKPAGGMYGDAAMKRFTANKERKHKQWDAEGK